MAMQMAWEAEQAAILAMADSAKARLALAESAQKAGLIRKAVTLYTGVAADKNAPEQAAAARQALTALQDEARQKFDDIETRLAEGASLGASAAPAKPAGSKSKSKPVAGDSGASPARRPAHPEAIPIPGIDDDTPVAFPGDEPAAAARTNRPISAYHMPPTRLPLKALTGISSTKSTPRPIRWSSRLMAASNGFMPCSI